MLDGIKETNDIVGFFSSNVSTLKDFAKALQTENFLAAWRAFDQAAQAEIYSFKTSAKLTAAEERVIDAYLRNAVEFEQIANNFGKVTDNLELSSKVLERLGYVAETVQGVYKIIKAKEGERSVEVAVLGGRLATAAACAGAGASVGSVYGAVAGFILGIIAPEAAETIIRWVDDQKIVDRFIIGPRFKEAQERLDAMRAIDDVVKYYLVKKMQNAGIPIPEEVAKTLHDDAWYMRIEGEVARNCAKQLFDAINAGDDSMVASASKKMMRQMMIDGLVEEMKRSLSKVGLDDKSLDWLGQQLVLYDIIEFEGDEQTLSAFSEKKLREFAENLVDGAYGSIDDFVKEIDAIKKTAAESKDQVLLDLDEFIKQTEVATQEAINDLKDASEDLVREIRKKAEDAISMARKNAESRIEEARRTAEAEMEKLWQTVFDQYYRGMGKSNAKPFDGLFPTKSEKLFNDMWNAGKEYSMPPPSCKCGESCECNQARRAEWEKAYEKYKEKQRLAYDRLNREREERNRKMMENADDFLENFPDYFLPGGINPYRLIKRVQNGEPYHDGDDPRLKMIRNIPPADFDKDAFTKSFLDKIAEGIGDPALKLTAKEITTTGLEMNETDPGFAEKVQWVLDHAENIADFAEGMLRQFSENYLNEAILANTLGPTAAGNIKFKRALTFAEAAEIVKKIGNGINVAGKVVQFATAEDKWKATAQISMGVLFGTLSAGNPIAEAAGEFIGGWLYDLDPVGNCIYDPLIFDRKWSEDFFNWMYEVRYGKNSNLNDDFYNRIRTDYEGNEEKVLIEAFNNLSEAYNAGCECPEPKVEPPNIPTTPTICLPNIPDTTEPNWRERHPIWAVIFDDVLPEILRKIIDILIYHPDWTIMDLLASDENGNPIIHDGVPEFNPGIDIDGMCHPPEEPQEDDKREDDTEDEDGDVYTAAKDAGKDAEQVIQSCSACQCAGSVAKRKELEELIQQQKDATEKFRQTHNAYDKAVDAISDRLGEVFIDIGGNAFGALCGPFIKNAFTAATKAVDLYTKEGLGFWKIGWKVCEVFIDNLKDQIWSGVGSGMLAGAVWDKVEDEVGGRFEDIAAMFAKILIKLPTTMFDVLLDWWKAHSANEDAREALMEITNRLGMETVTLLANGGCYCKSGCQCEHCKNKVVTVDGTNDTVVIIIPVEPGDPWVGPGGSGYGVPGDIVVIPGYVGGGDEVGDIDGLISEIGGLIDGIGGGTVSPGNGIGIPDFGVSGSDNPVVPDSIGDSGSAITVSGILNTANINAGKGKASIIVDGGKGDAAPKRKVEDMGGKGRSTIWSNGQ